VRESRSRDAEADRAGIVGGGDSETSMKRRA
jgi:hypothetical protein